MIIGISGRKNSGKDLVGRIIQYLTSPEYGHDFTLEEYLEDDCYLYSGNNWKNVKFADKLKDIVCILTGCTRKQLEDEDFKNFKLPKSWNDSHGINTYRELLQVLGTDCGRKMIHPNIWVNSTMAEYNPIIKLNTQDPIAPPSLAEEKVYPNWIITDVRFPNELKAISDKKGIVIRLMRESDVEGNLHESETALDNAEFDYIIDNRDLTINQLIEEVKAILVKENIILG